MTSGIDDGDIIAERRFEMDKDIWVEQLYQETVKQSKQLFAENIKSIISGDFQTIPQEELEEERGFSYHYRNEINSLKILNEDWSEEKKKLHVRATYMSGFEAPYAMVDGEKKYYDKDSF